MSRFRSDTPTQDSPFLHLKFFEGRPLDFAARHAFAHEVALAPDKTPLPEGLETDVQREGIARYLVNNFKEGSPVHGVIRERVRDSHYIMVNANWHRSSGDGKLHLSLYIYEEDRHVATWHAYTDRSLSLSASAIAIQVGSAAYSTPETLAHKSEAGYRPKPSRAEEEPEERRPFRPAAAPVEEAEDQGAFAPPIKKSNRHREPSDTEEESDEGELKIPPVAASPDASPREERSSNPHSRAPVSQLSRRQSGSRSSPSSHKLDPSAQAKTDDWDAPPPEDDRPPSDEEEGWMKPPPKGENAVEGFEQMFKSDGSRKERERSRSKGRCEEEEEVEPSREDRRSSKHAVVSSKPVGRASTRRRSSSRSRSPSPPPSTYRQHRESRGASPPRSPSLALAPIVDDRSPSPPPTRERGRQARSSTLRRASSSRSRSPVKPSKDRSPSPSKSTRGTSRSRQDSRSPSPTRSPPRQRTASRARRAIEREEEKVEEVIREVKQRHRDRSRSRSRSRSPSPPPSMAQARVTKKLAQFEGKLERSRSRSRSPSPPPRRRASPTRSEKSSRSKPVATSKTSDLSSPKKESRRHRSISPASSPPPSTKRSSSRHRRRSPSPPISPIAPPPERTITRKPSFRSVRRSLHPKDYEDEEDVLGDVDDPELDIPGGGETEVIRASRRGARKSRADESFDPEEVEKVQKERKEEKEAPPATTAAAVSGWFKGVGDFVKTKVAAATAQTAEEPEEDEEEERERRRARRERRKKRRERREAGLATDAEGTDVEGRRRRKGDDTEVETEVEEKPRKPSRRSKEEEPSSPVEDRSSRSRRTKEEPPASASEEEPPRRRREDKSRPSSPMEERSSRRRQDPPSPTESRSSRREQAASPTEDRSSRRSRSRQSTRPVDQEPTSPSSPPARLPIRQRALSISASVDAGLRGLRDSVAKVITDRVEATNAQVEADRKEQAERTVKSEGRGARSGRRSGGETDVEEESSRRRRRGEEEEDRSSRRRRDGANADAEKEDRSSRSLRRAASVAVTNGEESDASTRSDRRRKQRSDSEGDTPAHRLAKANASVNSTTIRPEEIASPARQVVPPSPSSNHPRSVREELRLKAQAARSSPVPSSTSRSSRILQEVERAVEKVEQVVEPSRMREREQGRSSRARSRRFSSSSEEELAPQHSRRQPNVGAAPPRATRDPTSPNSVRPSPTIGCQPFRAGPPPPSSPSSMGYIEETRPSPTQSHQSMSPIYSQGRPSPSSFAQAQPLVAPIPIMPRQSFPSHPPNFPGPPPVGYIAHGPPLARPEPIRPLSGSFGAPTPMRAEPRGELPKPQPKQHRKVYSDTESSEEEIDMGGARRAPISQQPQQRRRSPPRRAGPPAPSRHSSHPSKSSHQPSHQSYDFSDSDSSSAPPNISRRPPPSRHSQPSALPFPIPSAPTNFESPAPEEDDGNGTYDSDSSVDARRRQRVQSFSRSVPNFQPSDGEERSDGEAAAAARKRREVLEEERRRREREMSSEEEEKERRAPSSSRRVEQPKPSQRTVVSSVNRRPEPQTQAQRRPQAVGYAPMRADVASPSPTSEAGGFGAFGGFGREERRERREMGYGGERGGRRR